VFYILLFSGLAVLLVIAGVTTYNRNRAELHAETPVGKSSAQRRKRKAQRAQSKHDRRRR
jgi:hypothetical protein